MAEKVDISPELGYWSMKKHTILPLSLENAHLPADNLRRIFPVNSHVNALKRSLELPIS
jgi:hypothetical protein